MFKCTGVCASCGRCQGAAMMSGANDRKTKILAYPEDFLADKSGAGYGMAFDIGTTTVVGMLWDLSAGKQVDTCAKTNPQNEFGMDVISRINYCGKDRENLKQLRNRIIECLNEIIGQLCDKHEISRNEVKKVTVCGNTTMSHIFAGYSPASLAAAPFAPAYTGTLDLSADEADLDIDKDAAVYVVPNIAGHVGGDITAGIIAARVFEQQGITVFIDIGTNGEIVLTDSERVWTCSTAAGPAFEGAAILNGMRAATGAIEKVHITDDGDVFFKTIGECEPQGICGSGLIDAIAEMIRAGLINKKGRLACANDVDKKGLPAALKERLVEIGKDRHFILVSKEKGDDIVITQNDIREVQLAKGAVSAGIDLMLADTGRTVSDIDRVIIAGAFGSYIDKKSAVTIGLLPEVDEEKIISAGNTAGAGVAMALVSDAEMTRIREVPEKVEHIELAEKENFQRAYMKAIEFR